MHTHGTAGMGYGIATGQSFKHHTSTRTTRDTNTMGIPIPMTNPVYYDQMVILTSLTSQQLTVHWQICSGVLLHLLHLFSDILLDSHMSSFYMAATSICHYPFIVTLPSHLQLLSTPCSY